MLTQRREKSRLASPEPLPRKQQGLRARARRRSWRKTSDGRDGWQQRGPLPRTHTRRRTTSYVSRRRETSTIHSFVKRKAGGLPATFFIDEAHGGPELFGELAR
jgi:hypothetical protein